MTDRVLGDPAVGLRRWPTDPAQFVDTTRCPACFSPLASTRCAVCGLDVGVPAAAELFRLSAGLYEGEQARRATVTAPINGEVSNRQVSQGEAVSPGQTLFTVVNSTSLELAGQVPVDQAVRVRAGAPAEFTIDAYPGRVFRGAVARVEPTAFLPAWLHPRS